jgi:hypothetical protein
METLLERSIVNENWGRERKRGGGRDAGCRE